MLDETAINARIRKQFPFQILVLGRGVTFRESAAHSGRIAIDIEDDFFDVFEKTIHEWEGRRGTGYSGCDESANFNKMRARLEKKESIKQFLKFFVRQPIGPRLLILDKKKNSNITLVAKRQSIRRTLHGMPLITGLATVAGN